MEYVLVFAAQLFFIKLLFVYENEDFNIVLKIIGLMTIENERRLNFIII